MSTMFRIYRCFKFMWQFYGYKHDAAVNTDWWTILSGINWLSRTIIFYMTTKQLLVHSRGYTVQEYRTFMDESPKYKNTHIKQFQEFLKLERGKK